MKPEAGQVSRGGGGASLEGDDISLPGQAVPLAEGLGMKMPPGLSASTGFGVFHSGLKPWVYHLPTVGH